MAVRLSLPASPGKIPILMPSSTIYPPHDAQQVCATSAGSPSFSATQHGVLTFSLTYNPASATFQPIKSNFLSLERIPCRARSDIMSTLSLRLRNSLHEQMRQPAKREGISINQFVASAAAEKMSALLTEEYFEVRAKRASLRKFQNVLKKFPNAEPED